MHLYKGLFYALICSLGCICCACNRNAPQLSLQVEKIVELDSLPSGSGMVVSGDTAWIIGDDATGVYWLSLRDYSYLKIQYGQYDSTLYRIPKPVKPDFEAASMGQWKGGDYLLAFGSGSVPVYRDSLLIVDTRQATIATKVSLSGFYTALRYRHGLDSATLNIEGAATTNKHLYLLNRGRNLLLRIDRKAFEQYISAADEEQVPEALGEEIELPVSNGLKAGFSGATMLDDHTLLFSASLEDSPDHIADGTVLGSYIGLLDLRGDKAKLLAVTMLKGKSGKVLKDKIESVEIVGQYPDGAMKLIALVDNDDGSSKLMVLKLKR